MSKEYFPPEGEAAIDFPQFFFDEWYPALRSFTFASKSVDLTIEEAETLLLHRQKARTQFYIHQERERAQKEGNPLPELDENDAEVQQLARNSEDMRLHFSTLLLRPYPPVTLDPANQTILETLQSKIDGLIDDPQLGVFVKLSCRSPKDAAILHPQIYQFLTEAYQSISESISESISSSSSSSSSSHSFISSSLHRSMAFMYATFRALRVQSGAEALYLLVQSQRVYDDLQLALARHRSDPIRIPWQMRLTVRQWADLDVLSEVRVFLADGHITAMAQYHEFFYYPKLTDAAYRQRLELGIRKIVDEIRASYPLSSCTIDFAPEKHNEDRLWVIEMNPPVPISGTPLFTWRSPEDQKILTSGPFEFRWVQHPFSEHENSLPPLISDFFDQQTLSSDSTLKSSNTSSISTSTSTNPSFCFFL